MMRDSTRQRDRSDADLQCLSSTFCDTENVFFWVCAVYTSLSHEKSPLLAPNDRCIISERARHRNYLVHEGRYRRHAATQYWSHCRVRVAVVLLVGFFGCFFLSSVVQLILEGTAACARSLTFRYLRNAPTWG